ncbi:hydroxyisourate hydrolase [Sphingomonas sp. BIUV-7]|uniref:5-hydroxyisourate hydrolase n=1 Tax=Sphingomonas natans TaxID=3063330 RepID=A0ABT8Y6L0_9SPHN|nr:hydroxyisourate hydrolase [Sphingomonas sp. BIUV-7]MDO6413960.1 hydroxyisourate hydrolase [Sphingomonas sp. BIUV-7]
MSLSTHVLDTTHGCPAAGVSILLEAGGAILFAGETDGDGRCPGLKGLAFPVGSYRLTFAVADYFRCRGATLPEPPFLDRVSVDFGIADAGAHYHVPLLVSPFGYSTYRGS